MQLLKTFAFVLAAISLTFVQPVLAQDAQVDQARDLLQRGQDYYEAMEFADAKSTLLQIEAEDLPDSDSRQTWNDLLTKADIGLRGQQQGQEDYMQGRELINRGEFAAAVEKFQAVLDNQYIPEIQKKDAKAMLSVAQAKADRQQAETQPAEEVAAPEQETQQVAEAVEEEAAPAEEPEAEVAAETVEQAPVEQPQEAPAPAVAPIDKEAVYAAARKARTQLEVQRFVEKGNILLEANVPDQARSAFSKALKLDPENAEANAGFDRAQAMLATGISGTSLENLRRKNELALQEAKAKYNAAMSDSRQILAAANSAADFASAAERARFALGIINTNKQLLSADEFARLDAQSQDLLDHVGESLAKWNKLQAKQSRDEAMRLSSEFEKEQIRQRRLKIDSLVERAQVLMEQMKWDQSIEAIEEILRLEPNHAWASSAIRTARNLRTAHSQKKSFDTHNNEEQKHLAAFAYDTIPWYDLLRYPDDWDYLVRRRSGSVEGAESAEDRAVRLAMERIQPQFSFDDMEFSDAIDYIRQLAGVNVTINWGELDVTAGITPESPVSLQLTNVSALKALEEVLANVGGYAPLGYLINEGVVRISTVDDLSKIVETVVYDIKDIIFVVPNFQGPILSIESEEVSDGGSDGGDLEDGEEDDEDADAIRLANIDNLLQTIRESIAPETWDVTASIRVHNDRLIVTQTPDNQRRIADLLQQLRDSESVQINIEARYITVSTGFLNDVGLTMDFYLNTGSSLTVAQDNDSGTPDFTGEGPQYTQWDNGKAYSNKFSPIRGATTSAFTASPITSVPNSIGSALNGATGLSLAGTFLDDIQVDFLINATQADQRSTSFLAPRLTLLNGQRAFVVISQEQAYVSDLEPVTDENVAAYDPTVSVLRTGNTLDVEAVASADLRYVTMTLRPSLASVVDFYQYAAESSISDDGEVLNGVINLPVTSQTRIRATVKVPDGGTLLVGGERRSGEVNKEMGAPILNKIPILNRLFSNRSMARDEYMTMMLIKPTIIVTKEYESNLLPQ